MVAQNGTEDPHEPDLRLREEVWVRAGFGLASMIAAIGAVLFVRASPGEGTATAWTDFFGAYLALAAVAAMVAAVGRGTLRAACGGGAAGAAIAFNVLTLLSVGIFFVPLTVWLVAAARRLSRDRARRRAVITGTAAIAAPFLTLVVVHP